LTALLIPGEFSSGPFAQTAQLEARKNNSFMQNVNLKLTFQYVI
jgi:hypothetical protein